MNVNKSFVIKLVSEIRESISKIMTFTSKSFEDISDTEKYAIRYHLIVVAEALASLAIHIVRRSFNKEPETPIHAFYILREKEFIEDRVLEDLYRLWRLRNLLVHRYWVIDDSKIYSSIKENFKYILTFIERVMRYVGET